MFGTWLQKPFIRLDSCGGFYVVSLVWAHAILPHCTCAYKVIPWAISTPFTKRKRQCFVTPTCDVRSPTYDPYPHGYEAGSGLMPIVPFVPRVIVKTLKMQLHNIIQIHNNVM